MDVAAGSRARGRGRSTGAPSARHPRPSQVSRARRWPTPPSARSTPTWSPRSRSRTGEETIRTHGSSDLYVQQNTWDPSACNGCIPSTGWHTHPGPSLVIVTQGSVTAYDGDDPKCTPHVYTANTPNNSFVDPGDGHVHIIRDESGAPAQTIAVQLIPSGARRRQDVHQSGQLPVLSLESRLGGAVEAAPPNLTSWPLRWTTAGGGGRPWRREQDDGDDLAAEDDPVDVDGRLPAHLVAVDDVDASRLRRQPEPTARARATATPVRCLALSAVRLRRRPVSRPPG